MPNLLAAWERGRQGETLAGEVGDAFGIGVGAASHRQRCIIVASDAGIRV
jgi:hypothetical protein